MEKKQFQQEFNRLFKWFSNEELPNTLKLDIEAYKSMWNFLTIGPTYCFIINHHLADIEYVSNEVEAILGYKPSDINFSLLNEILHPDDRSWFLTFQKIIEFFDALPIDQRPKFKIRHDIRYQNKNGNYIRILYQGVILEQDNNGRLLRSLAMHTDISFLKLEGRPTLSFISLDNKNSYLDVGAQNTFQSSENTITPGEKRVLTLLVQGKSSKEISIILNISKQTVDTHRKNMLNKKQLNTTAALIGKAIRMGWV